MNPEISLASSSGGLRPPLLLLLLFGAVDARTGAGVVSAATRARRSRAWILSLTLLHRGELTCRELLNDQSKWVGKISVAEGSPLDRQELKAKMANLQEFVRQQKASGMATRDKLSYRQMLPRQTSVAGAPPADASGLRRSLPRGDRVFRCRPRRRPRQQWSVMGASAMAA